MKHVTIPDDWSAAQALSAAALLQRIVDAIWRAHGPKMASELRSPPRRHRQPKPRVGAARASRHHDIPF